MNRFDAYRERFPNARLTRSKTGVLEVMLHTNGGTLVFNGYRYTLELLPCLRKSTTPKLPVWGETDQFQTVDYAERFAAETPATRLVRIPRAGHIPMENEPAAVARALGDFFVGH